MHCSSHTSTQYQCAQRAYKKARRELFRAFRTAKSRWLEVHASNARLRHPAAAWRHIKALRKGFQSSSAAHATPLFRAPDGSATEHRQASDDAAAQHWQSLFNKDSSACPRALEELRQRDTAPDLAALPTDDEIIKFTRRAKKGKAPGPNKVPAELWQLLIPSHRERLAADPNAIACLDIWREIIHTVWRADAPPPDDWLRGKLVQLYKGKKDISHLKNWRVIMY
jgi:hypothetical protein